MRKDVKVGLVLSLGLVVLAGWYFVGRHKSEESVPLTDTNASENKTLAEAGSKASPAKENRETRRSARRPAPSPTKRSAAARNRSTAARRPTADPVSATKPEASPGVVGKRATLSEILSRRTDTTDASSPIVKTGIAATPQRAEPQAEPEGTPTHPTQSAPPTADNARASRAARTEVPPGSKVHVVGEGDTVAILAELYYGSQERADVILRANPHVRNPSRLLVGTKLVVPPLDGRWTSPTPKKASSTAKKKNAKPPVKSKLAPPGRTYTVKSGDSLYDIAERVLGDASRWPEIFELNKQAMKSEPDRLRIDQELVLPPKRTAKKGKN